MKEVINTNPGLVENDVDGVSCFLACSQMVFRTKTGIKVPSFQELGDIIGRKEGQYSWEYGMLAYMARNGFDVEFISTFNLERLVKEKNSYMYEYFGEEAADDQIKNSDMDQGIKGIEGFLSSKKKKIACRVPTKNDIVNLINEGFYIIPYINQRILQADPGYVAHTILVYGYSDRGVRVHNPG
ncbi:MAG: hypothetical protein M3O22_08865, partial [Pseudomonadota bacterium]|nr:hypothetical protein [Pseudomonadota bacterium]